MKTISRTLAVLIMTAPFVTAPYAAEEKTQPSQTPPVHSMPGMNMQQGHGMHGMGMMGMMGGMSEEQQDQHMRMVQEHMLQMHELSDKILATKDPQEKQKLKDQQLKLMKAHKTQMMQMMHPDMKSGPNTGAPPKHDIPMSK